MTTNNDTCLEINNLRLSFGNVHATNGVDLKIGRNELTAVIGPNGAGKTTLFNIISGFYPPDQGSIRFNGKQIDGMQSHLIARMGIARSFQITNIFSTLTVFENIQVACQVARNKHLNIFSPFRNLLRGKVENILETIGLKDKADVIAGYLSHGDQRTLEIGISLASDPELLLLDEPTSGMSSWETNLVTDLVENISQKIGMTIMFVEHDMKVAFSVAKKVIVMHQGRVFAQGTPEEIRNNDDVRKIYLGEDN